MMDESKDRLYSGALSQAAKKVLAVLYAQSSQRYPRQRQSAVRICESQTWLQSSMNMTQEEREGRDTQRETRPWLQPQVSLSSPHDHLLSQTSSCCQHMETSETCPSEQASSSSSSSCWGSSLHRHRLQNPAFGHRPQVYSHTQLSTGPIHQSSPSPIFMQDEVSKRVRDSSHRDDFTLTLQTPARFFKHQFEDTEDTIPSFVNSVSTDDESPDVVLVPTVEHSSVLHTEPASECQQVSFCCRTSVGSTANSQGTVTEMKENTAAADCYPQCKPPAEESRLERRGHVHRDTDLMVKAVRIHQDGNEDEKELKKQMELKQTNKMRRSLVLWTSEDRDKDLSPGCIPEGHEDKEKPVSDYNSSMKHISVSSERETSEVLSQSLDERAEEPHSVRTVELTRDEQVTAEVKADFEIRIKDKWTTVSLTNTTDEKESDLSRAQQRHGQGQMSGEEIKETSIKDSESMIPHMDRGAENTFTGDAGKSLTQGLSPECLHQNSDNIQNKSPTKTFLTAQDSKERKLSLFSPHQTPLHSCPLIHSSSLKRTHSDPQLQDHDAPPNTNPSRCGSKWKQKRVGERRSFEAAEDTESPSKAGSLKYLTSDPRVKDSGKLNTEEKQQMLKRVSQSETVLLTLVFQDGRTQLEPEQKVTAPVCGLMMLIIWKVLTPSERPTDSLGPNDSLVYLKLHKQKPAWVQHSSHLSPELFTRDVLLQVLSRPGLVVCYKAKDFLRTVLQFYEDELTWKQVAGCHIQDPQVSGWLLDPADPSSCFHDLLNKHCKKYTPSSTPGARPGSRFISALCSLYWLNLELRSKLQSHGLWELYSHMELNMIPVLAAMESQHIHVDKAALRGTSDLLGSKMKQLEQEAHRAAGQTFLITSNTQLRTVLFEKLRLDLLCENKKLPKTINKQQSTSEAVLLQLQDLHPLPKIILEYRQIHKIKSTFVDGILSCMERKNHISSTWYQTSVVTGRISAKHPNFQALPRQPLHITKKQHIHGKVEEVVTVHPRAMFIPQKGWTFLAADFCQVELRLLAHLSSDPELLRIFTEPQADVFTLLASQWKGLSECDVTPEDREQAKRMVYSVVYGAGRERLSGILGVSSDQARQFQDRFLQTYREVQAFIQKTIQICHKQGYVLSIMGRRRSLPHIRSPDWATRMQAERQAVNFTVQGSAADLCKMAMIRIFDLVSSSSSLTARLTAQLHDELLYEVEDSQVEEFAALVKNTMESLQHIHHLGVHLKVPLKVAVSCGKSWGSMSELNFPSTSPSPPL